MNLKPNVLIFSVYQKSDSTQKNIITHCGVFQELKRRGLPVVELSGRYAGDYEYSILIQGFENRAMVERMCQEFNQECYLESHNDRASFLVFPDGTRKSIGTLKAVSKEEAEASDSYSYNPTIDQHFMAK